VVRSFVPLVKDARLNEQHSGGLTGYNKRALAQAHGVEQVMRWRRSYDVPPPPLSDDDPFQRAIASDERYRDCPIEVPDAESLKDTCARVCGFWDEAIAPALASGQNVMVAAHGSHSPLPSRCIHIRALFSLTVAARCALLLYHVCCCTVCVLPHGVLPNYMCCCCRWWRMATRCEHSSN
jgi:bisphosphoglycerate-dependent phosphoglycerate mutase family 1